MDWLSLKQLLSPLNSTGWLLGWLNRKRPLKLYHLIWNRLILSNSVNLLKYIPFTGKSGARVTYHPLESTILRLIIWFILYALGGTCLNRKVLSKCSSCKKKIPRYFGIKLLISWIVIHFSPYFNFKWNHHCAKYQGHLHWLACID